ncbi:MAG: EAL domain-containing protein [Gammaproteobacteria bacterium]|nr:EAL domain-containing protein [Gammaproteobacteria bacterium]
MKASNKITNTMAVNSHVQEGLHYDDLKIAKIMMVDDEPIMLDIVQALLEEGGYCNFIKVEHSSKAMMRLLNSKPDILLLDLDMPEVNGFDLLKAVRQQEDYQFLPVIILTASEEPGNKLKALEMGATDFLSKPVDPSELVLRIRNTLAAKAYQDQLAYYDNLTGLPNRKLFIDHLNRGIDMAKRDNKPLALLDVGLDRFRQINETLGLYTGDIILKLVAQRLTEVIRSYDVVGHADTMKQMESMARLGADEFSIVLCGVNSVENASSICKRVLDVIKMPFIVNGTEIFLTANIGISVYPHDGEEIESLIKHAGSAKDFAKNNGTDNYQYYSSDMNTRTRALLKMESDLRKAVKNEEFELYYQPKVNSDSGKVMGMECLLRWIHPDEGFISPDDFIHIAENMGLIVSIGEWVLKQACKQTREWVDAGHSELKLSVNVSPRQFADAGLKASIESALSYSGLDPKHLVLEITESMLMGNVDHFVSLLMDIKNLGVSFSLDDFGTGYSSLSYLKRFPIDELKIDRSFLTDVPASKDDNSIVRAIIAMAHSLGQKVVAEGVEHTEQLEFLRQHNCDIIQGYYFSKPLDSTGFLAYLSNDK